MKVTKIRNILSMFALTGSLLSFSSGQAAAADPNTFPEFKIGDIISSNTGTIGCPKVSGMLQIISAIVNHQSAIDIIVQNQCKRIDPGTQLIVVNTMMTSTMRDKKIGPYTQLSAIELAAAGVIIVKMQGDLGTSQQLFIFDYKFTKQGFVLDPSLPLTPL
jgi:hypothetical protein